MLTSWICDSFFFVVSKFVNLRLVNRQALLTALRQLKASLWSVKAWSFITQSRVSVHIASQCLFSEELKHQKYTVLKPCCFFPCHVCCHKSNIKDIKKNNINMYRSWRDFLLSSVSLLIRCANCLITVLMLEYCLVQLVPDYKYHITV